MKSSKLSQLNPGHLRQEEAKEYASSMIFRIKNQMSFRWIYADGKVYKNGDKEYGDYEGDFYDYYDNE